MNIRIGQYYWLFISIYLTACFGGNVTVDYTVDSNFQPLNPDRGFYTQLEYLASSPSPLTLSDITSLRSTLNQTLILRLYYLDSYRTDVAAADIGSSVLDDIASDISTLRDAGVRAILRFAYASSQTDTPSEPTKERILNHISQITNTLVNINASDVVLTVQAGFIGPWGEWHSSTHFPLTGAEMWNSTAWEDRRQIISALMDGMVPFGTSNPIQIQVRTPRYKQLLLGSTIPLSNFSFSYSNMASVLAHHNDCFLASNTDFGTYTNITTEYAYLGSDTVYAIMGGETCAVNPPRSNCTIALDELSKFHWTFLNSGYNSQVLQSWKDGGCYDQVNRLLGYRFILTQSTFWSLDGYTHTNSFVSNNLNGSLLSFSLHLRNDGYAAPIRNRSLSLILRHMLTGNLCVATPPFVNGSDTSSNWRTFVGHGITHTISGQIRFSEAVISSGTYEVLLNVDDSIMSRNLRYKTKIANGADYNEAGTGFIKLMHTLKILFNTTNSNDYNDSDWYLTCDDSLHGNVASAQVLATMNFTGDKFLMNGNMEEEPLIQGDPARYWTNYLSGYNLDLNVHRSGAASLRVINGAARQTISLKGLTGTVVITGYSMAVGNVSSSLGSDYSLYVDVKYKSGKNLYGQVATFPATKNVWNQGIKSFTLTEPADYINLYLMYRNDQNSGNRSVYFDDITLTVNGYDFTCPDGYFQNGDACTWCPPGYACNGTKTPCSTNSFSNGGAVSCKACQGCSNQGNCSSVSGLCLCDEYWTGPFCAISVIGQNFTSNPSKKPSVVKTKIPSIRRPTSKPTRKPTATKTKKPTRRPTSKPTRKPTATKTKKPTKRPASKPTRKPTTTKTTKPTRRRPTSKPTRKPTATKTKKPTRRPTKRPTVKPKAV